MLPPNWSSRPNSDSQWPTIVIARPVPAEAFEILCRPQNNLSRQHGQQGALPIFESHYEIIMAWDDGDRSDQQTMEFIVLCFRTEPSFFCFIMGHNARHQVLAVQCLRGNSYCRIVILRPAE